MRTEDILKHALIGLEKIHLVPTESFRKCNTKAKVGR